MKFKTHKTTRLGDLITPVAAYMKLRSAYSELLLLESTDNNSASNSKSFICLEPLCSFEVKEKNLKIMELNSTTREELESSNVLDRLRKFKSNINGPSEDSYQGLFGFNSFESTQYFDNHKYDYTKRTNDIPDIYYAFYRIVVVFNHYNNELQLIENIPEGEDSKIDRIQTILNKQDVESYPFVTNGEIETNIDDEQFKDLVNKGIDHCQKGDVFQIVFSRAFNTAFKGDDFCVYRALRSINPSPYLFYFDYGNYKIFGSSPEAQLVVNNGEAEIHPIAGTYIRTGDDSIDRVEAKKLMADPKENSEHVMLVDLARNDLSINCSQVEVKNYKEIQYFSHVIHLVSKVVGKVDSNTDLMKLLGDSFPAGTLSGAPKHKAISLIRAYESQHRTFYGGSIGYMSLNSEYLNQAIIIRSFLSKENQLHFQAGAGIVIDSVPDKELQEVNNKLAALKKALNLAQSL